MATKKEKIAAAKSDGLQCCGKCQFRFGTFCGENTMRVCSVKYREGFLRGSSWKQRQKNKNNPNSTIMKDFFELLNNYTSWTMTSKNGTFELAVDMLPKRGQTEVACETFSSKDFDEITKEATNWIKSNK